MYLHIHQLECIHTSSLSTQKAHRNKGHYTTVIINRKDQIQVLSFQYSPVKGKNTPQNS